MSVYKSKRKETFLIYLQQARELRLETLKAIKKFPTSYRYVITNNMLDLASKIYTNCLKADSEVFRGSLNQEKYLAKTNYLLEAISSTNALLGEINFCLSLVYDGNNFFKDKDDISRTFLRWTEKGNSLLETLKKILKYNRQEFIKRIKFIL